MSHLSEKKKTTVKSDKSNITINIVNNTQKKSSGGGAKKEKSRFKDNRAARPLIQQFFNGFGGTPDTRYIYDEPGAPPRPFMDSQGIRQSQAENNRMSLFEAELPSSSQFVTGIESQDAQTQTREPPARISFNNLPAIRQPEQPEPLRIPVVEPLGYSEISRPTTRDFGTQQTPSIFNVDTQTDTEPFIPQMTRDMISYNASLLNEVNDREEQAQREDEARYANLLGSSTPMIAETETRPFMFGIGDDSFRATARENIQPLEEKGVDFFQDDEEQPLVASSEEPQRETEIQRLEPESYEIQGDATQQPASAAAAAAEAVAEKNKPETTGSRFGKEVELQGFKTPLAEGSRSSLDRVVNHLIKGIDKSDIDNSIKKAEKEKNKHINVLKSVSRDPIGRQREYDIAFNRVMDFFKRYRENM